MFKYWTIVFVLSGLLLGSIVCESEAYETGDIIKVVRFNGKKEARAYIVCIDGYKWLKDIYDGNWTQMYKREPGFDEPQPISCGE